jgi:hypothetical protein
VGQTIAFRGLSSLTKGRLVDRRQKTIVCPTWPRFGDKAILGLLKMIDENFPNELAKWNTRRLCFGQQSGFDLLR